MRKAPVPSSAPLGPLTNARGNLQSPSVVDQSFFAKYNWSEISEIEHVMYSKSPMKLSDAHTILITRSLRICCSLGGSL